MRTEFEKNGLDVKDVWSSPYLSYIMCHSWSRLTDCLIPCSCVFLIMFTTRFSCATEAFHRGHELIDELYWCCALKNWFFFVTTACTQFF